MCVDFGSDEGLEANLGSNCLAGPGSGSLEGVPPKTHVKWGRLRGEITALTELLVTACPLLISPYTNVETKFIFPVPGHLAFGLSITHCVLFLPSLGLPPSSPSALCLPVHLLLASFLNPNPALPPLLILPVSV